MKEGEKKIKNLNQKKKNSPKKDEILNETTTRNHTKEENGNHETEQEQEVVEAAGEEASDQKKKPKRKTLQDLVLVQKTTEGAEGVLYDDGFVRLTQDTLTVFHFFWPTGKEYSVPWRFVDDAKSLRLSSLRGNLIVAGPLFEFALCHGVPSRDSSLRTCIFVHDQQRKFPFAFICKNPEKVLEIIREKI